MTELSELEVLFVYERIKAELLVVQTIAGVKPNPIDMETYQQQIDMLSSITTKIEAAYPRALDSRIQKIIKEKANRKLGTDG